MATCKDCIHEKVCDAHIKSGCPYLDEKMPANVFCLEFKNKADVVEVKHGEWKVCGEDLNGEVTCKCSNCGEELVTLYGFEIDWNYCPECGAKMDGKKVEQCQNKG